ncbi:hypothetical protein BsWGS_27031 [Bradybaena similaris]
MTSRGNQSVSPPAQISQQRHVNAIPSSTPPPQQYYQGAPSTLSQGAYEFLPQAQGHPFNPYQAYGSSLSDTRAQPGNSGRGVPTQANLTQGNNYYQQPGPNIRPQQSHTYYITAQPQGNMRHPRPSPQSQMMFIAPNFTPANSVITVPANMYPSARVPMYPPTNFVPGAAPYPNIVYYQNGTPTWPRPAIPPAAASAPRPVQREKKVLSIMDPDTGRDITEELLNSRSHSVGAEEHHDELSTVNQNDKEICQTFTRLVADRLKSPDDSSTSAAASDSQASVASATISSTAAAPSSQQYQPPLPQQHTQQQQPSSIAAATAMRPPAAVPHTIPATHSGMPQQTSATHSGMPQQTPAIAAHSHDTQHQVLSLNLSMPPPQYPLRQPTPTVYAPVSQQHQHPAAHHAPRHTHSSQPQQQQPIRAPGVPVIHPPPQQTTNQLPQPQYQPPQPVHPPVNTAIDPVPQPLTVEPCVTDKQTPLVEATSQDNIPAKPAGPASSSTVAPATVTSALPQMVEDADIKASSVKQAIIEEASIIDRAGDNGKVDASQGVISQGMKDGRKGKKGKKDFSRREIGGSDMDAFIDQEAEVKGNIYRTKFMKKSAQIPFYSHFSDAYHHQSIESKQVTKSNPVKTKTESDSASLSNIGRGSETMATAKNVVKRDPKNPWNIQSAADTTTKRDTHNPWAVRGQEPAQAKLSKVDGASSGSGENTRSGSGENTTRTNNALDVAPVAGSSGATVHHSGQKVADVAKAIPVVSSGAPESGDLNTQRHVSTAQASDIPLDGDPPREDSPSTHKTAETQKQTAPAQVQSEVVEVDDKHPQCQPVTECKYVDKPAGGDIKPSSASIALSQESSSVRVAKLTETSSVAKAPEPSCVAMAPEPSSAAKVPESSIVVKVPEPSSVTKLPEPSSMAKMPVRTVTPVPPPEDTEKKASLPTATYISAPIKNQNQPQAEQTGHTFESSRVAQGPTDRHSSKPFENGIADFHAEPLPTISIDAASDLPKSNYPFIDESESSELVRRQKNIDVKKGQTLGSSSSSASRQSSEKTMTPAKKDAKDKLQYDRAYLMELRECSTSQTKPEGLPNLEIILDRPVMGGSRGSSTAPLDFTPTFFQQTAGNQRHAPPIGKTNSRNRSRTDVQMPQRIIKSVSLQDSVKPLHQCDKPWKPTPKVLSTGEKVERTLESKVLGIMNKLTPTTFEKLAGEMMKLNISTYSELQELVKIFFDKVTMETKFVGSYAILCKLMAGLRVPPPPNSAIRENQATFRVVMLTKCQQEFEADKTVVFEDPEEKRRKIEAEMPDGPERAEKIENTLYQMKLKRLKFYGNIRFIGELYKLNMLTETIMHDCILRLLKARDDDSLVSLCNLITTVGQSLDSDKARTRMDQYFAQMAKIADERKSRIKFTLKDVIDLRSNGWTPRKEQTGPKKLEEVHKDYQEEQATKQFLQNQPLPPRNDPQPSSRRGSRQRQDENKPTDDGWNTVGSKSLRIDASKMKLSKNVVDEDNIKLGPGGGMKQFSMWSRGSGAQPSQDERQSGPSNRFSALRGEEERRNYQRSPSRGDSNSLPNRNMRQGPSAGHGRGKIMARSSQEGDRRDALASARSIVGGRSQNSSRDNSWNREDRRHTLAPRGSREGENVMTRSDISLQPNREPFLVPTVPAPVSTAAPAPDAAGMKKIKPLSESEMEFKAKTILDEYLSVLDLEEAKLCLRELTGQQHLHLLVTACVNEVLERSTKDRAHTGQFFHEMVKHGLLPMDIYLKGLADVLQYAEDIVIDIPMMWSYLAQIILPMLIGGSLQWASLPDVLKPYLGGKGSAILVVEILLQAREKVGEDEVTLMWQTSGLTWTAFLPAEEVDRFLKDKRLEFTVGQVAPSAARVPVYGQLDSQKFIEDISNILRERGTSSEICAYVEANVRADKQDRHFIRSLVTAMVNASISTHTMKFNEDIVKTHKDVLQRYIKSNPDLELQALYAIQALMHKLEHPSGVIANIFDVLYDEEVISEEAFKQWEKSSDVLEVEGKGACSMQLTQFFTWLRENEEFEAS